jgi:hypothetical protein
VFDKDPFQSVFKNTSFNWNCETLLKSNMSLLKIFKIIILEVHMEMGPKGVQLEIYQDFWSVFELDFK